MFLLIFFFLSHFHNPPLCCLWDNQNVWRKQNYIIGLGNFYVLVCRKQKTKYSIILMTFSGSRNGIFWLFASEVKKQFRFHILNDRMFQGFNTFILGPFSSPSPFTKEKKIKKEETHGMWIDMFLFIISRTFYLISMNWSFL